MFQVSLFLSAFLLMIPLLDITPDPFKFTAFFTCAPSFGWQVMAVTAALAVVYYLLNKKFDKPVLFFGVLGVYLPLCNIIDY